MPLQAADYLAWLTKQHIVNRKMTLGFRRLLAVPHYGFDYDYDKLIENYKDWDGSVTPLKTRR